MMQASRIFLEHIIMIIQTDINSSVNCYKKTVWLWSFKIKKGIYSVQELESSNVFCQSKTKSATAKGTKSNINEKSGHIPGTEDQRWKST